MRTCLQAVDGECGLSQEVLVVEHVYLINHKTQEGKGRVAHCELERLSGPCGVQTVISCSGEKKRDVERKMRNVRYVKKVKMFSIYITVTNFTITVLPHEFQHDYTTTN